MVIDYIKNLGFLDLINKLYFNPEEIKLLKLAADNYCLIYAKCMTKRDTHISIKATSETSSVIANLEIDPDRLDIYFDCFERYGLFSQSNKSVYKMTRDGRRKLPIIRFISMVPNFLRRIVSYV